MLLFALTAPCLMIWRNPLKCTVCTHSQCRDIEQALLSEEFTLAALSQKFGPSISALQRHKGHLRDKMRESRRRFQEIQEQGSLLLLNAFLDHVKKGVEAAEAEGNLAGVFRGSYIGSRIIYQLNRMEASISLDPLHRLLTSPGWVPQGSLLPTDPKLIADLHQALVDGAGLLCPEPCSEIPDDDRNEDEDWKESEDDEDAAADAEKADGLDAADLLLHNAKLASAFSETENCKRQTEKGLLIRQLQELLPDLDLTLDDLPPRTEKVAKNYRKISEISAKNNPGLLNNGQQNHQHTPSEKKLPKNPGVRRDPKGGASQNEVHPADLENEVPPAVSDTASSREVLDEALAAELSAYLKDFAPYARPAPDPAPNVAQDPKGGASQSESLPAFRETAPAAPAVTNESEISNLLPGNLKFETVFPPETENGISKPKNRFFLPEPPEGVDYCAAKAADLFLMTHGYPRDNPPKHLPDRRRDEDLRGFSLFREIKRYF